MAMPEPVLLPSSADLQPGAVCLEHCAKGAAQAAALKVPSAAALQPALVSWLRLASTDGRTAAASMAPRRALLPHQPPPFIRFAVLRI